MVITALALFDITDRSRSLALSARPGAPVTGDRRSRPASSRRAAHVRAGRR